MTILEMREKRIKLWEAAKAFLDSKRGDNGLVSNEDAATYDKMEDEIVALGKEIDRLERQETLNREMGAMLNTPITSQPTGHKPLTGTASDEYKQAFWNAVRVGSVTDSLKVGTDSQGGYLVPDEFERTLVESLEEHNIMRQLARTISTSSGELQIPVVATKGTASWVDEEGEIPESDNEFAQITLSAYKVATMIKVSQELLDDSAFPLDTYIASDFGRRIGSKEEEAFIIGNGTKKPTGVLSGAQIGATAASTTAVTIDSIMDLYYSLKSPYRNKAAFILNDLTVKAVRKLKDTTGQYLWQPAITAGTPDMIMGRPLYTSGYMPEMAASAKVLGFGDFTYYWIGDRQGRRFKRLNELFSKNDQIGFMATQRVDGKLVLPEAVKVLQMAGA